MKKHLLLLFVLFALTACILNQNSGANFEGTWKESRGHALEMTIQDRGNNNYYISFYKTTMGGAITDHYTSFAILNNGELIFSQNNTFPNGYSDRISFASGKLIFDGNTYKK